METTNNWWDFRNPVHIVFGRGRLSELTDVVGSRKAFLVTTAGFTKRGVTDHVRGLLNGRDVKVLDNVLPNPDLRDIERDCQQLLGASIEVILGLGGGSAIDTAKALSFGLKAQSSEILRSHFENGAALPQVTPIPVVAIPTTAGTGSEVTPFATIWDKQRQKKYSLQTPWLYPEMALLDPMLTLSVPEDITVATGLDALSQAMESLWNRNATPITTTYALRAIGLVLETLPQLVLGMDDLRHRTRMMEASLLAGLAISRTRTALAHSMSYPITARYGMPHGLACSFTLPAILEFNLAVDDGRLAEAATRLGFPSVEALKEKLLEILAVLEVGKRVRRYVSSLNSVLELVPDMITPGRAENNLGIADMAEIAGILSAAWRALEE